MKKMLSILGSIGLVATGAMSVISCGSKNSDDANYNKILDLINSTRGTYDNDGNATKDASTKVIYIGAKDNQTSQSFQLAISKYFGGSNKTRSDFNSVIENLNSGANSEWQSTFEEDKVYSNSSILSGTEYSEFNMNSVKIKDDDNEYWEATTQTSTPVYGFVNNEKTNKQISFESVILDTFSGSKTFSNLLDNYFVKDFMIQEQAVSNGYWIKDGTNTTNDSQIKGNLTDLLTATNSLKNSLNSLTGPLFLVVRNGHLVGVLNGFTRLDNKFFDDYENANQNNKVKESANEWLNCLRTVISDSVTMSGWAGTLFSTPTNTSLAYSAPANDWPPSGSSSDSDWDVDKDQPVDEDDDTSSVSYSYTNIEKYA